MTTPTIDPPTGLGASASATPHRASMGGIPWTTVLTSVAAAAALAGARWPWWWTLALPASLACLAVEIARRARANDRRRLEEPGRAAAARFADLVAASAPGAIRPATQGDRSADSVADVSRLGIAAVQALARERDNLREVIDAVGEPLLVSDDRGALRLWNLAAEAFLSRSGERLSGRSIEELFTSAELVALHAAASSGSAGHGTVRLAREGGVRLFEVLASPVAWRRNGSHEEGVLPGSSPGSGASGAVLTLRDVTELATASKLRTDFVANASHELRTPLSSIRGAVETLTDDPDNPALRTRLLAMIASNVARLEELTRDLLDLSRLESTDAGPSVGDVRASDLAESLSAYFEAPCARRHVSLRFELAPELEHMRTDAKLLDLILRNLIENSVKFAYENTAIRIVGEALPAIDAATGQRRSARFRVIDSGQGIPLAAQPRIFERFYQVDQSRSGHAERRGSGLGLAIVKHAIKTLGGTIAVESVWKQGTTMSFEIPGSVDDHPGSGDAATRAGAASASP